MKTYVVGFLFIARQKKVLLIEKSHPDWQKGLLNGVGGHIEPLETPIEAMCREFKEETGMSSGYFDWDLFLMGHYNEGLVYFYRSFSDRPIEVESPTEEKVGIYQVADIRNLPVIPNLNWIIPLALDPYVKKTLTFQTI